MLEWHSLCSAYFASSFILYCCTSSTAMVLQHYLASSCVWVRNHTSSLHMGDIYVMTGDIAGISLLSILINAKVVSLLGNFSNTALFEFC